MEKAKKPRAKFYVDKKGKLVHDAVIFMLLSMIFRLIGCWGSWNDRFYAGTQIVLPLLAGALFVLCLRFLGDKALWSCCLPAVMGAAFFVFRALGFENWVYTALSIACAVLAALVYIGTALGYIRSKWFLPPLFALPFLYHVAVVDVMALRDSAKPVLFSEGMLELSLLCIMLSLLFSSLAIKRRKTLEEAQLPKIKDPVVIAPKLQAAAAPGGTVSAPAASVSTEAQSAAPAVTAPKEQEK